MGGTPDLNQLLIFVRVVEAGSFSEAARQLNVPKSTVSRKVSELEARVGARLVQRTTRKVGLSDAGRAFFERIASAMSEIEEAERAMDRLHTAPRGLLRVTAPLSFGMMLGPIVAEYVERHPDVQVEMVCTDRRVDLVEERFDVAIRAGALADSAFIARSLGKARAVLVAAPGYCERHGTPAAPADLSKHAAIVFGVGAAPHVWVLESADKRVDVRVRPRLTVNDLDIVREAARAGVGIGWLPQALCGDDLRTGRLRHLLVEWCVGEVPVTALYPSARHLSPKVVAFVDLVAERFRSYN